MQLTGPQSKRCYDLLLIAFPSYPELERIVFFGLGERLPEIIVPTNLRDTAFELLKWTRAHDRDDELVTAAVEANTSHQALRAFAIEVGVLAAPKPTDPVPPPSPNDPSYHTLIVDPWRRAGKYHTISAAIAAAQPGDRIVVHPGTYNEGLVLDKPLEIVGEGDRAEIVVQASGAHTIQFLTSFGRVQNLTIRQTGGGDWFGVDIAQGRLELEDCDIRSAGLSCVAIHDGADPRLRRNRIHDSNSVGVFVYDNGQGLLEENDIEANVKSGVVIATGGNPTLRGNRIHQNGHSAIWIHDGGAGTFENNDLRDNTLGAWNIDPACLPNVKRSGNIE